MGIKYFLMMGLAFVLVGCSPVVSATSIPATNIPEIRPIATLTPKAELTITPTTQAYPDNITRECVDVISQPPSNVKLTGLLVIYVIEEGIPSYLLDLSTGNKTFLGRSSDAAVSKDGSLVAYWDSDTHSVIIADNTGKKIRAVPDPDERLQPAHWLDNHQLLLNHRRGERDGPYIVDSLMILDALTGKMQEWLPDYPNLDTWFFPVSWKVSSRFLVNPALMHLVYQSREAPSWLIMWDINTKKEIARIFGLHNNDTPWWSPDGSQIVTWGFPQYKFENILYFTVDDGLPYVDGSDLYTIDTTGKIKRLTYFTTTKYASESSYIWSPDGKAIAFMLQTAPDSNSALGVPELSVLDMQTGEVTNLCIPAGSFTWSLDGKYIAINQGLNEKKRIDEVYMVDLKNKLAWKVIENAVVEGWMTAP